MTAESPQGNLDSKFSAGQAEGSGAPIYPQDQETIQVEEEYGLPTAASAMIGIGHLFSKEPGFITHAIENWWRNRQSRKNQP